MSQSWWPSWRFEHKFDQAEKSEKLSRIAEAKAEAEQALETSKEQLEEVRRITKEHAPIRKGLRHLRMENHFAEGLMRIIEEGR
jgi:hypothetical protein